MRLLIDTEAQIILILIRLLFYSEGFVMSLLEILLVAIGVAADAFAV